MEKKISLFGDMKKEKDFNKSKSKSKDKSRSIAHDTLELAGGVLLLGVGLKVLKEGLN